MKKKVALLLALVMMLSALPMNVFGNPAQLQSGVGHVERPTVSHINQWMRVVLQVPLTQGEIDRLNSVNLGSAPFNTPTIGFGIQLNDATFYYGGNRNLLADGSLTSPASFTGGSRPGGSIPTFHNNQEWWNWGTSLNQGTTAQRQISYLRTRVGNNNATWGNVETRSGGHDWWRNDQAIISVTNPTQTRPASETSALGWTTGVVPTLGTPWGGTTNLPEAVWVTIPLVLRTTGPEASITVTRPGHGSPDVFTHVAVPTTPLLPASPIAGNVTVSMHADAPTNFTNALLLEPVLVRGGANSIQNWNGGILGDNNVANALAIEVQQTPDGTGFRARWTLDGVWVGAQYNALPRFTLAMGWNTLNNVVQFGSDTPELMRERMVSSVRQERFGYIAEHTDADGNIVPASFSDGSLGQVVSASAITAFVDAVADGDMTASEGATAVRNLILTNARAHVGEVIANNAGAANIGTNGLAGALGGNFQTGDGWVILQNSPVMWSGQNMSSLNLGALTAADQARMAIARPDLTGQAHQLNHQQGWFTVRLVAQQHYRWNTDGFGTNPGPNYNDRGFNHARLNSPNLSFRNGDAWITTDYNHTFTGNHLNRRGTTTGHGHNFSTRLEYVDGVERDVLYVRINANGTRSTDRIQDQINILNLSLYPTAQAPLAGNVYVDAYRGWSSRLGSAGNTWQQAGHSSANPSRFPNLLVGVRGSSDLALQVEGDIPTVQSGYLGTFRAAGANEGNRGLAHYRGVRTATVVLGETFAAGAFGSNWDAPIDFTFPEGIRILGADIRTYGGSNNLEWTGWLGAAGERHAASHQNVQLSADLLRIHSPANQFNMRDVRRVEVNFYLSVEAGFEHKYGADIAVTVDGRGVVALSEANRSVVVARAQDPVSVSLPEGVTVLGTAAVAAQSLSDVVVTVNTPSVLEGNSEIWLYLVRPGGAVTELTLNPGIVANYDVNTGLILEPARILQHSIPAFQRDGVAFTVRRQPNAGQAPFDITFSNIAVTGRLIPGAEYQVVVSGNRIAQNDQVVRAGKPEVGVGNIVPHLNAGTFTTLPYANAIAVSEVDVQEAPAPAPELPPAPPAPEAREFRLQEGVPFGGVAEPLIWHIVGPNRVGMVSMRAFAVLVGADPETDIVWNSAERVAEVRGLHFNGETVGIAVQMGNTNATVVLGSGAPQTVDIATAVNFLSGPAGTVEPLVVNDHVYLPLRFMAETFGFTVERQGNIVIFR